MYLHTVQFNPIIDILTRKKVTKKIFIFSAGNFECSFVMPWWGPMAIPSAPKRILNSSWLIWV